jgi:hypothetical protein
VRLLLLVVHGLAIVAVVSCTAVAAGLFVKQRIVVGVLATAACSVALQHSGTAPNWDTYQLLGMAGAVTYSSSSDVQPGPEVN